MPRILVADDQPDVLAALRLLLKSERFTIESASSPAGVLKAVDSQELDVVLIDLNYARDTTSGSEGLDLLTTIQAKDPTLPVVVMTAWGSVDLAVSAPRLNWPKHFVADSASKPKIWRYATAWTPRGRNLSGSLLPRRQWMQS